MPSFFQKIAETLGRMSASERRLLALLGVAILAAGPVLASQAMQEAASRRDEAVSELQRVRQLTSRSQPGAAGDLAAARSEIRSWSWQADRTEVGKVLIQDRIIDLARKAGLANLEVKLTDKTEQVGDVQFVRLELTSDFSWSGLNAFASELDAMGKGFLLDAVQMSDSEKPRLKIILRALLTLAPANQTAREAK